MVQRYNLQRFCITVNHFLPVDGDEVADVLVVSVVLPAELYPALGLLVHLGLVHAVRLAQLPGTLGVVRVFKGFGDRPGTLLGGR